MFENFKKYKYLWSFLLSIIFAIILYFAGVFNIMVVEMGSYGYIGAFFVGMMFASTFTAASATFLFLNFGSHLNPWLVILLGGLGAMTSDLFFYELVSHKILTEIKALGTFLLPIKKLEMMEVFSKKRVFLWGIPFVASLLIASPLPDELGVALFSLINFKPKYLSVVTFLLNTLGIFILVFLGYEFLG